MCKQRPGEQCNQYAADGFDVCHYHGARAAEVNKGKPNLARYEHGERSEFEIIRKAELRKLVAKAAKMTAEEAAAYVKANLKARRERRALVDDSDPNIAEVLDSADRKDVDTITRVDALMLEAQADKGGNVTIVAPQLTGLSTFPVRGPGGMVEGIQLPDGRKLVACSDGAYRVANIITTEEGAEVWTPLLEAGAHE
jgi:hypothetical protein